MHQTQTVDYFPIFLLVPVAYKLANMSRVKCPFFSSGEVTYLLLSLPASCISKGSFQLSRDVIGAAFNWGAVKSSQQPPFKGGSGGEVGSL